MEKEFIAMCGLDCGRCAAFVATKNNDNELREKTAKEWSLRSKKDIKPEDINCLGCLSKVEPIYANCLKCQVRKCGLAKGIKNCKDCQEYKCEKLAELQKRFF